MLAEAVRDGLRHPQVWLAGAAYGAVAAGQVALALQGEAFYSTRLPVLGYLALPFLLAGAYGVLASDEPSLRLLARDGLRNYFRVLLPGLVAGFLILAAAVALLVPLSLAAGGASTGVAALAVLGVAIPVGFLVSLYDTAACYETIGVFASLRRSIALVLGNAGRVVAFWLTTLALLALAGFAILLAWTTLLLDRLEPLAAMTPADAASFGPERLAALIGPGGIALTAICYGLFVLIAFVLVTSYKARLFRSVADATPAAPEGVYDEKGRWYRY